MVPCVQPPAQVSLPRVGQLGGLQPDTEHDPVLDNQHEGREALTPRERERLRLAEKDLRKRVKRARTTAKDSRRDDRKASIESISRTVRSMLELLKELLKVWG